MSGSVGDRFETVPVAKAYDGFQVPPDRPHGEGRPHGAPPPGRTG